MTTIIQKWGNSHGIRLPKTILDDLNMHEGQEIAISVHGDTIILKAAPKKRKNIQELFKNYMEDYEPEGIIWGEYVGDEQ